MNKRRKRDDEWENTVRRSLIFEGKPGEYQQYLVGKICKKGTFISLDWKIEGMIMMHGKNGENIIKYHEMARA